MIRCGNGSHLGRNKRDCREAPSVLHQAVQPLHRLELNRASFAHLVPSCMPIEGKVKHLLPIPLNPIDLSPQHVLDAYSVTVDSGAPVMSCPFSLRSAGPPAVLKTKTW